MTPNMAQKIAKISAKVPSLKKTTQNTDAGFNYVSIDDYYEQVAKLVRDGGLIWTINERDVAVFPIGDDWYVRFQYQFSLYDTDEAQASDPEHGSGNFQHVPSLSLQQSVIHPLNGAQTTGSAASYAEKIFLRTLFKVVTGEPDADAFAKPKAKKQAKTADPFEEEQVKTTVLPPKKVAEEKKNVPKLVPAVDYPVDDSTAVDDDAPPPPLTDNIRLEAKTNVLIGKLALVTNKIELKAWKDQHQNDIDNIKTNHANQYARIEEAFAAKVGELNGRKK